MNSTFPYVWSREALFTDPAHLKNKIPADMMLVLFVMRYVAIILAFFSNQPSTFHLYLVYFLQTAYSDLKWPTVSWI